VLDDAHVLALVEGRHGDPFAVLGPHRDTDDGPSIRAFVPGAVALRAVGASGKSMGVFERRHEAGVFERTVSRFGPYALEATWPDGSSSRFDDPYRFGAVLGELDAWLLAEGTHLRPFEVLGAHPRTMAGVEGTAFAVWAPNARRASVVGDWNHWDGRRHPMRLRRECGVWELFLPGVRPGARYKFELIGPAGELLPQKADPYARAAELRPATASVVAAMPERWPPSEARARANALDAPMSVYEVHAASWRRTPEGGWLDWDALAGTLVPYAAELGFTHLELLPVGEHPFDGSWGYQSLGLYAVTARHSAAGARHGSPEGFRRFVEAAHAAGLGVIVDWVPAHFPTDAHGLVNFDGTHLYEYADRREGFHNDWNTLIYNFGRTEVRNFLVGSALYWLERLGVDGLRVDAVASMLYRDYSRPPGEWIPNVHGGRENLEAISLLKRLAEVIGAERPQCVLAAEESTAFPAVSRPVYAGGLGFHHKWNMGWMHDTLAYMAREPVHRRWHQGELSFGLVYAFSENFVLPLSHDEVVHGKGSLLAKMPGDDWQRFANLRAFYGFMWGHPGKKLLFMGGEFAQAREWNHDTALDWHLLDHAPHAGVQRLVRDLNRLHAAVPALHRLDFSPAGFEWIVHDDAERSILAFLRHAGDGSPPILVLCNFTPVVHEALPLGVPLAGTWREVLNTDSRHYGGSDAGTPLGAAASEPEPCHGRPQRIRVTAPPLATVFFQWQGA
jgi:1,4-alpha-glucan branching enzyme